MNRIIVLTVSLAFVLGSCGVPQEDYDKLKSELEKIRGELTNCSTELKSRSVELTEIKNTPEQRFFRAEKLFTDDNLIAAKSEYQGVIENYIGTKDANIALIEIRKIEQILETKQIAEERKKALGFKILKPRAKVKFGDLSLKFNKIWTGKRWTFDDYGSKYFLRDASRGYKHVLARVSITSKNNNPSLPAVMVYQMDNGELHYIGTLGYEFRRWKDYGAYLGNYADYGNDFAHSETIPFSLGIQLSNDRFKDKTVFVVMKKSGCFNRQKATGNPEIEYTKENFTAKDVLKVEDFENDYVLLKVFN